MKKKTNVIDITDEKEETRQPRKPDQDKPNKVQEEKKQETMTRVSFATGDIGFYEQDPRTEEYKPRYQTPADFMQPVKQRIHHSLRNISPQEGKKVLRDTSYQERPKERNKVEMIGCYTPTQSPKYRNESPKSWG